MADAIALVALATAKKAGTVDAGQIQDAVTSYLEEHPVTGGTTVDSDELNTMLGEVFE